MKTHRLLLSILCLLSSALLATAQPTAPVPGYSATAKKVLYNRDALLAQSKLPPLVALPVPKNPIPLPDDWDFAAVTQTASGSAGVSPVDEGRPDPRPIVTERSDILANPKSKIQNSLTIHLSQPPPGKLLIRRVANNDGKLYLEIYSPAAKLTGAAEVHLTSASGAGSARVSRADEGRPDPRPTVNRKLGTVNFTASTPSLWLSLKPRIGKLTVTIHAPTDGDSVAASIQNRKSKIQNSFTIPTTLVEIRDRQIYLNGEPFLIKGATESPRTPAIADYARTLGINALRGADAADGGEQYGFMAIASLNSINAPKDIFGKPDAAFWKVAQPYIDRIPETAATTIANPYVFIVQLGNERTGGGRSPGIAPLSDAHRQINQMLVHARNAIKPLCPMLPLGYASQDLGHIIPDSLDVVMHNSFLDKDRYNFPWERFLQWQGCVPPYGPNGKGRPFVNSEFGANRYLSQAYHDGPNNPVLEKLHAWNIPARWTEFMKHGTAGGAIYKLTDSNHIRDQGSSRFGILTYEGHVKLACWDVARIWRDFAIEVRDNNLHLTYKRDYHARNCVLTITPVNAPPLRLKLDDFAPHTTRTIPLKTLALPSTPTSPAAGGADSTFSPSALQPFSPLPFRWRIDFTTHSGLPNAAAGAHPASLEEQDFLALLAKRDTAPFLTELFDTEVLTADGKPAPLTLAEMANAQDIIPVILRKRNGVAYLIPISRELITGDRGPIKENITLDIAFKGRVEQVDDMTGRPLPDAPAINATPTATGQRLKNIKAARIPGAIGQRSEKPFTMPVYRITP